MDQAVREMRDGGLIAAPPARISLEQRGRADVVVAGRKRISTQLGQARDITQSEIESLTGNGMQIDGRIADQCRAWADDASAAHAV